MSIVLRLHPPCELHVTETWGSCIKAKESKIRMQGISQTSNKWVCPCSRACLMLIPPSRKVACISKSSPVKELLRRKINKAISLTSKHSSCNYYIKGENPDHNEPTWTHRQHNIFPIFCKTQHINDRLCNKHIWHFIQRKNIDVSHTPW